jgi:GPH family glycoside/pentoside/hexuronide:cation symporter
MAKDRTQIVADLQKPWSLLTIRNYIASVLASFGQQGLTTAMFSTYFTMVYSVYLGVAADKIAVVVSVGIVIDGVSDFVMGIVCDRFRTKWGKAKHWFIWMAIPCGLLTAIAWSAPEGASETTKLVFAFIVYNLFCTAVTTVRIPNASIGSLVSSDFKVRGNLGFFIGAATTIATSVAGWLYVPMQAMYGDTLKSYRMLALVCGILATISLLATGLLMTEERTGDDWKELDADYAKTHQGKKASVLADLGNLVKNKYWIYNTLISFCSSFAMGFAFGSMAYFMQFVIGDMSKMALLLTVMSIPNYIGCMAGLPLNNLLEARTTLIISNILQTIACAVMWAAGAEHFTIVLIGMGFKAFCTGATTPATTIISANIVDYGEWRTGVRQDALTRAWTTVFQKISSAIVTAALGFAIAGAGYTSGTDITDSAKALIEFFFLGFSTFMCAITSALYFLMDLSEKKMVVYRQEVAERKAALDQQNQ